MISKKIFGLWVSLIAMVLSGTTANAQWNYFNGSAFTTKVEIVFWHPSTDLAEQINHSIFSEFERIDQRFSRYKDSSEVAKINQRAANHPITISAELFTLLEQAQQVSHLSAGAFDITFSSVGHYYDYRTKQKPSSEQLSIAGNISFQDIQLDSDTTSLLKRREKITIDLGGIAKGYAIDQAINILKQSDVKHARVSAGGDTRLLGDKRGKPWIVAIRDPRSENNHAVTMPLSNVSMSTSGDYERYFIDEDDTRIHHILTPSTGKPATGVQSVSILGPNATTTDALSTAVFVLGVEKGMALVEKLPGIDAVIIDAQRKMHFSEGLAPPNY